MIFQYKRKWKKKVLCLSHKKYTWIKLFKFSFMIWWLPALLVLLSCSRLTTWACHWDASISSLVSKWQYLNQNLFYRGELQRANCELRKCEQSMTPVCQWAHHGLVAICHIDPAIHFLSVTQLRVAGGQLKPIPAGKERKWGCILDRSPVRHIWHSLWQISFSHCRAL